LREADNILSDLGALVVDAFAERDEDDGGMRAYIGKDHPLGISDAVLKTARRVTMRCKGDREKAETLYRWMAQNIAYKALPRGYRNARRTFEERKGICGEATYLYLAMARSVGVECYGVHVYENCNGETTNHACAEIVLDDGSVLVDPTMRLSGFGARHRRYARKSDEQLHKEYLDWNGRGIEAAVLYEHDACRRGNPYHHGSCDQHERDLRRYVPLTTGPEGSSVLPALALIIALAVGGYGAYRGGSAFWSWFTDDASAETTRR
jgi:hypothetical protein